MGDSESEDDVQPARKKNKYNSLSSDEEEKPKRQKIEISGGDYTSDSDDIGISDIDLDDDLPISLIPFEAVETPSASDDTSKIEPEPEKLKNSQDAAAATNITTTRAATSSILTSSLSSLGNQPSTSRATTTKIPTANFYPVNRIIPSKEPAVRGTRRRPTLIVCPTSLLSHWCAEIDKHVESNINIKVHVHYGPSKAQSGAELNACDIVITSYGTLAAENDTDGNGPLMKAKWLRVVLDEGHYIKNHR